VIKAIREITNLGSRRPRTWSTAAPKEIKAGVSKDDAETIKKKIRRGWWGCRNQVSCGEPSRRRGELPSPRLCEENVR